MKNESHSSNCRCQKLIPYLGPDGDPETITKICRRSPPRRKIDNVNRYFANSHIRLIALNVHNFINRNPPEERQWLNSLKDDMQSAAYVKAIMYIAKSFDPDCGIKFSAYATTAIQNELHRLVRTEARLLNPSGRWKELHDVYIDRKKTEDENRKAQSEPDEIESYDSNEQATWALQQLSTCLTPVAWDMVTDRLIHNTSPVDIAAKHGVTVNYVQTTIRESMKRMRAYNKTINVVSDQS